ncbi:MAG: cell wall-binding repeat-containing protein [Desulfitobacteriia bacterium]|jgi:putative cell wall-binding protein
MQRKEYRVLGIIMTFVFLMFSVITPAIAQPINTAGKNTALKAWERIYGSDRYETAVKISQTGFSSSEYAVLGAGMDQNLVDALAAAPLAKLKNAPILFSAKGGLSSVTQNELQRLGVKKVYLVTGTSTFEPTLFEQLEKLKITVLPLGGSDRFQTAVNIARELGKELGTPQEVIFTTAWNNADALSMASIAAAKGIPILLTDTDTLPASVSAYLNEIKGSLSQSYIIGGEQVVGSSVQNLLSNGVRIGGHDRFATNIEILKYFAAELHGQNTFLVNGTDQHLVDALTIATLAAKTLSPVVLTGAAMPEESKEYTKKHLPGSIIPIGGEGLISQAILDSLRPNNPVTSSGGGGGGGGSPVVTVNAVSVGTPPAQATYTSGDNLDLTGLIVTLTKTDSSSENVALADFGSKGLTTSPANGAPLTTAHNKVTITHTASGKKVDQAITVAPATIDIAALSGVTPPVTGETPVSAITATAQYTGTVAWSPAHNPFQANTDYTATITLSPKTEYTLSGVAADFFNVAGATTVNNVAGSGVITAVFPKTEPAPEFAGGTGTVGDPYQVATPEHLNNIRNHLGAHFIQTADIDLATYLAEGGAGYNGGLGWAPIGATGAGFTGSYDGNHKTISNLTINRPAFGASYIGLFGKNNRSIKNVYLINVDVTGYDRVGGLAGSNGSAAEVINSYSTGTVKGDSGVGGLVGTNSNSVTDSYSTCQVSGTTGTVGGLIGSNNGTITSCYATGNVSSGSGALFGSDVGGLVGSNANGTIAESYATGNVTGNNSVGGLVGYNISTLGTKCEINNCYATGNVTSADRAGGLVGSNDKAAIKNSYSTGSVVGANKGGLVGISDGTVTDSYWDTVTSGLATSAGGAGAVGKLTLELQDQTTFTGWDFVTIWNIGPAINNGYPFLR